MYLIASENRGLLELSMLPPSLPPRAGTLQDVSVLLACVVFALWNPGSLSCKLCGSLVLPPPALHVHSSTIYYILVCVKSSRNSAVISKTIFSTVGVRLWRRHMVLISLNFCSLNQVDRALQNPCTHSRLIHWTGGRAAMSDFVADGMELEVQLDAWWRSVVAERVCLYGKQQKKNKKVVAGEAFSQTPRRDQYKWLTFLASVTKQRRVSLGRGSEEAAPSLRGHRNLVLVPDCRVSWILVDLEQEMPWNETCSVSVFCVPGEEACLCSSEKDDPGIRCRLQGWSTVSSFRAVTLLGCTLRFSHCIPFYPLIGNRSKPQLISAILQWMWKFGQTSVNDTFKYSLEKLQEPGRCEKRNFEITLCTAKG